MNLVNKDSLSRSWDVHAERLLECTSCHFSTNQPAQRQEGAGRPPHLRFDPRTTPIADYLQRPSHTLAHGVADAPMRRCDGCHDPAVEHGFLPDPARHFEALACEACHVPQVPWGPLQQSDATAVDGANGPLEDWRGTDGTPDDPSALQAGYQPILLPRTTDGVTRLSPYHVATRWGWVSGGQPVALEVVGAVFAEPATLALLDADSDGALSDRERRLDTPEKAAAIAARLRAVGVAEPQIAGVVEAYPVSHGVVRGAAVTRTCTDCHGAASRLDHGLVIAEWSPGGVAPVPSEAAAAVLGPDALFTQDGALWVRPPAREHRYVFGADRHEWLDRLGLFAVLGAVTFAGGHGALRNLSYRKAMEKR